MSEQYQLRITPPSPWLIPPFSNGVVIQVLFNSGKGSCARASSAAAAADGGVQNATMTVKWQELGVNPECMLSTLELITME